MNVGIYQGATAMAALENWQAVLSQNIASATVAGYKRSELAINGLDFGTIQDKASGGRQAAVMPSAKATVSFLPGDMKRTGNATDVAIGGQGFFVVRENDGTLRYTRNGEFSVNAQNELVTGSGEKVMGAGGPITLLPTGQDISIDPAGEIYQGNQLVGKLNVVDFADSSKLIKVSGGFHAGEGAVAAPVGYPNVAQGYTEGSNVSAVEEMVKLIQVTRAQEANQKVIASYDNRLARVIQTFNS